MTTNNTKTSIREKIGYGLGDMSSSMFWKIFSYYLPIFYSDVFGLKPAHAAMLLLITKLYDAVSDPVMGLIADRTRTRWGRYRPWLLWVALPFALVGILSFYTPDASYSFKHVYAYVTYLMMMTVYTAINVPYGAMLGVMTEDSKWLEWATRLQTLAQNGLAYSKDEFDIERFQEIRQIAAEMLVTPSGMPLEKVKDLFCNETGYQTPKLDTRAAIFKDNMILLVQEKNGLWALPGGWCDVDQSVKDNTIKEVREEAGLEVQADKLIAVLDKHKNNPGNSTSVHHVTKIFVLCTSLGGEFRANAETIACGYFALDALPALSESKTTTQQIAMCFEAQASNNWETRFD